MTRHLIETEIVAWWRVYAGGIVFINGAWRKKHSQGRGLGAWLLCSDRVTLDHGPSALYPSRGTMVEVPVGQAVRPERKSTRRKKKR